MGKMSGEDLRGRLAALVDDARAAGLGWDDVAAALGTAADDARRHAAAEGTAEPADGAVGGTGGAAVGAAEPARPTGGAGPQQTAKVGPVTLFNEMGKLEAAGRHGWRVVGSGTALHVVTRTTEQWEYRRVFASRATGRALETDGWQRFSSGWFPWGYYQRPTGLPAEEEPVIGGYLLEP